ncbi:MAG: hypothetical protein EOO10_15020 [Chitinophagaceae bacterium]|nr:MAG: hypothetical protein EOO10_15020 [Chitinophagaceae bacterium]
MQVKRIILLSAFLFQFIFSFGQAVHHAKVNTAGAEAYFEIASALVKGGDKHTVSWQRLFQAPAYQMMIAGNAFDTAVLKSNMQQVFSPASTEGKHTFTASERYHKAYKDNQKQLESYTKMLHQLNVVDSVKALLNPLLPLRLQREELFPTLFYLNYGSAEATGFGGVVFNDLLHAYTIDKYKFGLLAAHEAFHAVVSVAFQQKLKSDIDYSAADFNLLYFIQNVAEEGIADLIDKPILLQTNSPVYKEVKQLTEGDESPSIILIKKLDSVLTLANRSDQALQQYSDFTALASAFGKNGGHVPGRFMGDVIKKAGLLPTHIDAVENPFSFLLTYSEAAKKNGKKYPYFSTESLQYLQKLKAKYWQE